MIKSNLVNTFDVKNYKKNMFETFICIKNMKNK